MVTAPEKEIRREILIFPEQETKSWHRVRCTKCGAWTVVGDQPKEILCAFCTQKYDPDLLAPPFRPTY